MRADLVFSLLLATSSLASAGTHEDLLAAVRNDRTDQVVSYVLQGADPDTSDAAGTTLLMTAAANGNLRLVSGLLALRAATSRYNRFGETALALAALNGHGEIVRLLVEKGAPINGQSWAPLHYAVFNGHQDIVRYLIEQGAHLNARAPNRHTPLMLAARNGHGEIVRMLLAAGANPELGDLEGQDALTIATQAGNGEIASLLLSAGTGR